jgi:hypothetical protein
MANELGQNYREYRTVDKSEWPRGDWDHEPDKAQWIDEATGLDCLIVRNRSGALCGYVGVDASHPLHRQDYDKVDVEVHGGLTFADRCADITPERHQKALAQIPRLEQEAQKYPRGDAARYLRELASDYDEWKALMESRAICHIPASGRADHVWWFGFDCAHSGDVCPAHGRDFAGPEEWYKPFAYVVAEVRRLAVQLATLTCARRCMRL